MSDDTQMTLFTAEGLLREYRRSRESATDPDYITSVYHSYLRWLYTQGEVSLDTGFRDCLNRELVRIPELNQRRGPGNTCRSALISGRIGTLESPINTSKGCGGIMRIAPVGLFCRAIPGSMDDRERGGRWPSISAVTWPPLPTDIRSAIFRPDIWRPSSVPWYPGEVWRRRCPMPCCSWWSGPSSKECPGGLACTGAAQWTARKTFSGKGGAARWRVGC